jgi:hypothetical protein
LFRRQRRQFRGEDLQYKPNGFGNLKLSALRLS